jgi:hypothetical protein
MISRHIDWDDCGAPYFHEVEPECVSKKSKLCTGFGNDLFQGMCSNCLDEANRPERNRKKRELEMEQEAENRDSIEAARSVAAEWSEGGV